MITVDCTIHLVCLQGDTSKDELLKHLNDPSSGKPTYLIKATTHGWVHRPHKPQHKEILLAHRWDVFLLTQQSALPGTVEDILSAHVAIPVSVPQAQFQQLEKNVNTIPKPNVQTPPLPKEWPDKGGIPQFAICEPTNGPLKVGELNLDPSMSEFLSMSLPTAVKNAPVGLFNLFMYPNKDPSVHEHYMEGFRRDFGDAAGVAMKFMGPVKSEISYRSSGNEGDQTNSSTGWQDANSVQYDTAWHYAYMLSTKTYAELNKEKISGLDDTCILLTSEMELA